MVDISWYDSRNYNGPYDIELENYHLEYNPSDTPDGGIDCGSLLNYLISGCEGKICDGDYRHDVTIPLAIEIIKISSIEFLNKQYSRRNSEMNGNFTALHLACGLSVHFYASFDAGHRVYKKGIVPVEAHEIQEIDDILIRSLIEKGADINRKDSKGVTPFDVLYAVFDSDQRDEWGESGSEINFNLTDDERKNVYQKCSKKMKELLDFCKIPTPSLYAIQIQKVIRGIQSRKKTAVTKRPTLFMLKKAWPEVLKSLIDNGMAKKEIKKFRDEDYFFKIKKKDIQDLVMATIKEKNKKIRVCCVCLTQNVNSQLKPCDHMIMCHDCAQQIKSRNQRCPFCRADIEIVKKLYKDKSSSGSISSSRSKSYSGPSNIVPKITSIELIRKHLKKRNLSIRGNREVLSRRFTRAIRKEQKLSKKLLDAPKELSLDLNKARKKAQKL